MTHAGKPAGLGLAAFVVRWGRFAGGWFGYTRPGSLVVMVRLPAQTERVRCTPAGEVVPVIQGRADREHGDDGS